MLKICFFLHVGLSIISITQNLNNLKSCARKRIPKHAGLRMSLRNSLRSTEFITLLNNLGCCFSYDGILRVDTKWANALPENDDSYTKVLKNIISGYFTQASANNAHYVQESTSQHVRNAVSYQRGCLGNKANIWKKSTSSRRRPRSLLVQDIPLQEFEAVEDLSLPAYFSEICCSQLFPEDILKNVCIRQLWIEHGFLSVM